MAGQNENVSAAQPVAASAGAVSASAGAAVAAQPDGGSAGVRGFDAAEFQRLQRIEQEYRGMKPFVENARASGFSRAEDFERWAPVLKTVKDPAAFVRAYEGEPAKAEPFGVDELSRLLDERDAKKALADAERAHWAGYDADHSNFADEKIEALIGKDAPKELRALVKSAMLGDYHSSRTDYEAGHPLHGRMPKTMGSEWFEKQGATYKAHAEALKRHFQGAHLAAVGEAATKAQPAGAAGGQPGTKAPEQKEAVTRAERTRQYIGEVAAKVPR